MEMGKHCKQGLLLLESLLLNIYLHTTVLRAQWDRIIGNYSALPGTSLVVQCLRPGLIPDPEAKILHAAWPKNK